MNGFDLAVANGYLQGAMEHRFPVVLGKDFAGEVDAVGAGVEDLAAGDRVFGVVTKPFLGDGSFAEYVTVPAAIGLARIPAGVSFQDAAALGLAGTAATDSVDAANITTGTVVLVAGATGGVGTHAVQLAARAGAHVIATARTDDEQRLVSALGAAETVDYTTDIAKQVRAAHPDGVDVVLHFAGDPAALAATLTPGGVSVSTLAQSAEQAGVDEEAFTSIQATPTPETLDRIAADHADQRTQLTIEHQYGLEDAAAALGHFTRGTLGKLVITVS